MRKILFFFIIFLTSTTLLSAHKLSIFAYYEDGKLNVESFFSDGTGCKNCDIKIYNNSGKEIYSGKLDAKGEKIIPIKLNSNIKIKVIASIGHESTFNLKINGSQKEEKSENISTSTNQNQKLQELTSIDTKRLIKEIRKQIKKELEIQLRPIIMQLAKLEGNKTEKIIAGIGYIFGIFGLFMLFKRKQ